jgi:hypothetical protein
MAIRPPMEIVNHCHWSSVSNGTPVKTFDCGDKNCPDSINYGGKK